LLRIQWNLLKVLRLDGLQPCRNLLNLRTSNLSGVEICLVIFIALGLALDTGDKIRELGHVSAEKLDSLVAELPSIVRATRVTQDLELLCLEFQVETEVETWQAKC
jgi:hypothetical protein